MGNRSSRTRRRRATEPSIPLPHPLVTRSRARAETAPLQPRKNFIYKEHNWNEEKILHFESEGLLAPRKRPLPDTTAQHENECSICFNVFEGKLNQLICCKYKICTECFLQVRTPPVKLADPKFVQPSETSSCPFCRGNDFNVVFPPNKTATASKIQEIFKASGPVHHATDKQCVVEESIQDQFRQSSFVGTNDSDQDIQQMEELLLSAAIAESLRQERIERTSSPSALPSATDVSPALSSDVSVAVSTSSRTAPQSLPSIPMSPPNPNQSSVATPQLIPEQLKQFTVVDENYLSMPPPLVL